jgi:hypothetical protein
VAFGIKSGLKDREKELLWNNQLSRRILT